MSAVAQLGYLGFEVRDLAAWERFAVETLGVQLGARGGDGSLLLRVDEAEQRLALHPGEADDLAYIGWEVANAATLADLGKRLQQAGFPVEEGKPELLAARRVGGLLRCADPAGIPTEIYWGQHLAATPFHSSLVPAGFRAGEQGVGHMVISAAEGTPDFYTELLGLRVSDYIEMSLGDTQLRLTFLHANPRHHSVAFSAFPLPKRIHHLMLEVNEFTDVGRAHDRCVAAGVPIAASLGQHSNDGMFSFYAQTPSGFEIEFGWGGVQVDDESWRVVTHPTMSHWGHQRGQG